MSSDAVRVTPCEHKRALVIEAGLAIPVTRNDAGELVLTDAPGVLHLDWVLCQDCKWMADVQIADMRRLLPDVKLVANIPMTNGDDR